MWKLGKWFGAGSKAEPSAQPPGLFDGLFDGPLDLLSPEIVADPYPAYAALRARGGPWPLASGGVLLTRHSDVKAAFNHKALGNAPSRFSTLAAKNKGKYPAADLVANIPPFLDMPGHKLARQALSRAFFETFGRFEETIAPRAAQALADAARPSDLIADIARPFALDAMAAFVGIEAPRDSLKRASGSFFHLFAPITDKDTFAKVNAELSSARSLFRSAVEAHKSPAAPTLLSALAAQSAAHPDLTDAQIADFAYLVFADGIENVEAAIALCFDRLAREHAQADEAHIREALRLDSPAQIIPRVAKDTFFWGETEIVQGTPVFLALASANRDAEVFADPERFDPERFDPGQERPHMIFGLGRHSCIGAPLALRLVTEMVRAAQKAGLGPADPTAALRFTPRFGHRWPVSYPVARM